MKEKKASFVLLTKKKKGLLRSSYTIIVNVTPVTKYKNYWFIFMIRL